MLFQQISNLPSCWQQALASELNQPYLIKLNNFLNSKLTTDKPIYPVKENWLRALQLTPLNQVKLVLVGQDPYHGAGQAEGLSFSVAEGIALPPSLKNIYKELTSDLDQQPPLSGSLIPWAKQGVLLLNRVLTVEEGRANSHQNQGWEEFTAKILQLVNQQEQAVVFLLWGKSAIDLAKNLNSRHLVLTAPHPSPLSAYRGFLGCKHFSKANAWLAEQNLTPINWL